MLQSALRLIYPPECLMCRSQTDVELALCGSCWRDTPFIAGLCCDLCGIPLPGQEADVTVHCDDCLSIARPWSHGRAVTRYDDTARRIVLALKHGDREDLAGAFAAQMLLAAAPFMTAETVFVPVPLHWFRLLRRGYNQSALLAQHLASLSQRPFLPDSLMRIRHTPSLKGRNLDARFSSLDGAIKSHPRKGHKLEGRDVVLVDDVMTTGATLAACTLAAYQAGAADVSVLLLARAGKDA